VKCAVASFSETKDVVVKVLKNVHEVNQGDLLLAKMEPGHNMGQNSVSRQMRLS
jgi:hypothetical protein